MSAYPYETRSRFTRVVVAGFVASSVGFLLLALG